MVDKTLVRDYWQAAPCGTVDFSELRESELWLELERERYDLQPFIPGFAAFSATENHELLEVGIGAGTDHLQFARAGAKCTGIDLTAAAVDMTQRRLAHEGLTSDLQVADAENLPFEDERFDFVYSWGVIHHTPNVRNAAEEILRVLKPGGRFCVMVYNRHSLVAAQSWLIYGLLRGHPFQSLKTIISENIESKGTQAFTSTEAIELFGSGQDVSVTTVPTPWDMRVGRRRFLPEWTLRLVPSSLGWFHVIQGTR